MAVACLETQTQSSEGLGESLRAQRWYVLKVKPHKEAYVQEQLDAVAGFDAYFPRMKTPKRYLGKYQKQFESVFPGYVFVKLDLRQDIFRLHRLQGHDSLVRFDGRAAQVEETFIEEFRKKEGKRGYVVFRPRKQLSPQEPVTVIGGAFRGHTGRFLRYNDGATRVCLLIDMMSSTTQLDLPEEAVEAVKIQ